MPTQVELTPKQRRFCEEYLVDLNQTQAAIRAGYSKQTAPEQASRLITNVKVQSVISELMAARSARTQIEADEVIREIAAIAFANVLHYGYIDDSGRYCPDLSFANRQTMGAVRRVRTREYKEGTGDEAREVIENTIDLGDKLAALEKLAKHLGIAGFVPAHLAAQTKPIDMAAVIEELTRRPINPDPNNVYIPPPPKAKRALLGPAAPYRPPKKES